MASSTYTLSAVVLVLTVIVAVYYNLQQERELDTILKALLRAEAKAILPGPRRPRVAVGLGACLDVRVDALRLFRAIGYESPSRARHHDVMTSEKDVRETFAYFFEASAASERYVSNRTLFNELLEAAKPIALSHSILGGNAATMARRFANEGCDVLLGARMSESTANVSLSPAVKLAADFVEEDDVHLCIEYNTADKWGRFASTRANRFYLHSDIHNPQLGSLDQFAEQLKSFSPSLVVIGGLQMMDNYPFRDGERQALIKRLADALASLPESTLVHFEMASLTDHSLLDELIRFLLPHVDSLGMNEQELPNLISMLKFGNVTLLSEPIPRVASVLDEVRALSDLLNNVSRLHVHTLAFQAIVTVNGSPWRNSMAAAAKASLTANRYVCNSARVDLDKSRMLLDDSFSLSLRGNGERVFLDDARPVACWKERELEFCVAPGLVCTDVFQTSGCGDNISSATLVAQFAAS